MKRPGATVGAELVPLLLILASLAGSLGLIVSAHRPKGPKRPEKPAVSIAFAPAPRPIPKAKPAPVVEDEPEPPAPPVPQDPTPGVLAKITSAEADELLETSRADRKAAALDEARKSAEEESERWRRRESLVHAQLSSLDGKLRSVEATVDAMALERDALERERDARKAAIARGRSRPGQAILPHKGPNGTWRRPIVVECRNGMAILQPRGVEFGLMELESGFGPTTNPFVAAVAREAIRIQSKATPDGEQAIPYIFFVVRPDGIRPYYEARGRLEPLGITFGYELADQEWDIDFPDLDDLATWDGSGSRKDKAEALAAIPATGSGPPSRGNRAEDADIPSWPSAKPGSAGLGGDFAWPPKSRFLAGSKGKGAEGGKDLAPPGGSGGDLPGGGDALASGPPDGYPGAPGLAGTPGLGIGLKLGDGRDGGRPGPGPLAKAEHPGSAGKPGGGAGPDPGGHLGGPGDDPMVPGGGGSPGTIAGSPGRAKPEAVGGRSRVRQAGLGLPEPIGQDGQPGAASLADGSDTSRSAMPGGDEPGSPKSAGKDDPGVAFVWPSAGQGPKGGKPAPASAFDDGSPSTASASSVAGKEDEVGGSPSTGEVASAGKAQGGSQAARRAIGSATGSEGMGTPPPGSTAPQGLSLPMPSMDSPPPASLAGLPPIPPPVNLPRARQAPAGMPDLGPKVVDRTFEVVVVCGKRGITVQPGGYRVTADALRDRDGLFKKQIVGLVKNRRMADPKVTVEPRVRFLIQPGGFETYRAARSQFLLSGLGWPESFHVADPDPLAVMPSESW